MCLENPQKRCKVLVLLFLSPCFLFVWLLCVSFLTRTHPSSLSQKKQQKKRVIKQINEPNGLKTFQMICIAASAVEELWLQALAPDDYE